MLSFVDQSLQRKFLCSVTRRLSLPGLTIMIPTRCKSLPNLLTALPHPCQWTLQPAQIQYNPIQGEPIQTDNKEPLRWDLSNGSCKRSDGAAEQSGEISNWDPREPGGDSSSYLNLCGILIVGQQSLTDFHLKILDNILNTPGHVTWGSFNRSAPWLAKLIDCSCVFMIIHLD